MYSFRIEQAIRAASVLHRDQLRKGSMPYPYITHLMAVSMILMDYTEDEDTIVAALLHDTIEDTDYTEDELREDFGGEVADIVMSLSEPKHIGDKKLGWKEMKKAYAKQLKKAPEKALMISAADKSHNFRTIVEEYYDDHPRFFKDFGGSLEDRVEVYQDISNVINSRLNNKIVQEFNHVFEEYKNFVYDVKKREEERF
ncbi:HD domain-containing protein [Candidatus Kaiserbacteria bacterium]|nr:HD domain-containing protein [Candidatus Kaiserbacteria bacterium]